MCWFCCSCRSISVRRPNPTSTSGVSSGEVRRLLNWLRILEVTTAHPRIKVTVVELTFVVVWFVAGSVGRCVIQKSPRSDKNITIKLYFFSLIVTAKQQCVYYRMHHH